MTINPGADSSTIVEAAREALAHGYQPVPIRAGSKAPMGAGWTHRRLTDDDVAAVFEDEEVAGIGLLCGDGSNGLVDVDLDHPIAWRLASIFLPPTPMRTGRIGNPSSHYWYRVTDSVPGYRKYTLPEKPDGTPGGETAVELRAAGGHQTVIPPSIWHPKKGSPQAAAGLTEEYRWEGDPWGGEEGPTEITGKAIAVRVASLALATTLVENWPKEGSRHDAYLALAGGMLRYGREGVHPYWSRALPQLIEALAEGTHDNDGGSTRIGEVVPTTVAKIAEGRKVQGWTTLEGILGEKSVERARTIVREIESIVDWQKHLDLPTPPPAPSERPDDGGGEGTPELKEREEHDAVEHPDFKPSGAINPLDDRESTWETVNLEPYLAGEVTVPEPAVLRRSDGKGMFYPGRVNSLYGRSESAKSWVAMYACLQEISIGERIVYVDLEDDPAMTILRLRAMGAGDDDIRYQFHYMRPEGPHVAMQRDNWGNEKPTEDGHKNAAIFAEAVALVNPGLIVVDGMSVLYGLHGLNTNDVGSTDVITNWLKGLTRNGRTTVVVIDHTAKGSEKGATPIGSQHKISMVQGAAIQVVPVIPPRPGIKGHVELVIGKDRPGGVRAVSSDEKHQVFADVWLDSTVEGVTRVTIEPPKKGDVTIPGTDETTNKKVQAKVDPLRVAIMEVFENHAGFWMSRAEVSQVIDYDVSESTMGRRINALVAEGILLQRGVTRGSEYVLKGTEVNLSLDDEVDDTGHGGTEIDDD